MTCYLFKYYNLYISLGREIKTMKTEKNSAVKKLRSIHDSLNERNIEEVKEQRRELDTYQAAFGKPECDTGERIPEP